MFKTTNQVFGVEYPLVHCTYTDSYDLRILFMYIIPLVDPHIDPMKILGIPLKSH